jgi:hypothetical protein
MGREHRFGRVRQLEDAAGLQAALRADRIPIRIAFQVGQPSDSPPLPSDCANVAMSDQANAQLQAKILGFPAAVGVHIALTVYPGKIPRGVGIYLAVRSDSDSQSGGWGLDLVQASTACTG